MRIFVAGFSHETNTFAPTKAEWSAFTQGSVLGPYLRGPAMLDFYRGQNVGLGGFEELAASWGWTLVPSALAGANPSAEVTRDAFERIAGPIIEDLRLAGAESTLDGIYLDLHGAGVSEDHQDAEGELIRRCREVVGNDCPIVCSLDLHANVTRQMLSLADGLVAYRTYPHIDMAETGRRAARLLSRRLATGAREPVLVRRLKFLLPINAQCTDMEPASSIYRRLGELEQHPGNLSFAMGFPAADFPECGPVVWGYGAGAREAVNELYALIDQRSAWKMTIYDARDAVALALESAADASAPVVIADTQDNPWAGGDGNTTGMLRELLAQGAGRRFPGQVALSLIADPDVARMAHAVGVGSTIEFDALGRSVRVWGGRSSDAPVRGRAMVRALSDGQVTLKGPMSMAGRMSLGASACLDIEGILVVVTSSKTQALDRELLRFVDVHPEAMKIVVLKSSVHFRADFTPIASQILVAKAAGPMAADPGDLPWKHLPDWMDRRP